MRDLHVALKFIQNKLNKDEQIIITKEGFDIMLVESKNILEPMDTENTEDVINGLVEDADVNPVPRHIYGVDVEMHRHMYGQ